MKRHISRLVVFQVLIILAVMLSACSPANNETTQQDEGTPTEAATATLTPEPTAEPTATPTPIPTARPLIEENPEAEPGSYINDFIGLTFEFPTDWEILLDEQSGFELFAARDPDVPLVIYVTSYILEEDVNLEEDLIEYMGFLGEDLEMSELDNIEIDPAYPLANDLEAWHGVMRSEEVDGTYVSELIGVERAGRVFTIWFLGWEVFHEYHSSQVDEIRQSINIYSPTPYGVDRENAFFIPGAEPKTFDRCEILLGQGCRSRTRIAHRGHLSHRYRRRSGSHGW
ncbi:MAG: hypothetical protein P8Y68_20645 [Anaerolineales bacterium]